MSLALVKDLNALVFKIVKLNCKIANLRREHNPSRKSLSSDRTSAIRCSKCEGYGRENYQCPN